MQIAVTAWNLYKCQRGFTRINETVDSCTLTVAKGKPDQVFQVAWEWLDCLALNTPHSSGSVWSGTPTWEAGDFFFWSRWISTKKVDTTLFAFVSHKGVLSLYLSPMSLWSSLNMHAAVGWLIDAVHFVWCNFMSWTQADPINSLNWSAELVHVRQTT